MADNNAERDQWLDFAEEILKSDKPLTEKRIQAVLTAGIYKKLSDIDQRVTQVERRSIGLFIDQNRAFATLLGLVAIILYFLGQSILVPMAASKLGIPYPMAGYTAPPVTQAITTPIP